MTCRFASAYSGSHFPAYLQPGCELGLNGGPVVSRVKVSSVIDPTGCHGSFPLQAQMKFSPAVHCTSAQVRVGTALVGAWPSTWKSLAGLEGLLPTKQLRTDSIASRG